VGFLGVDGNELLGMREGQRFQQDAVDEAVNGGGGSDAEGEGENGGEGESRRFTELPEGEAEVSKNEGQNSEHGGSMVNSPYHSRG
jgi:hypothetical protein